MVVEASKTINIFYSYAPEDEQLQAELAKHLATLKRNERIKNLHRRVISPGMDWKKEIDDFLNSSDIILLLVSPDFIASDYCYGVEMKRAMERREAGKARVIPILLRPVVEYDDTPLGKLQPLPMDGKAITIGSNRNAAFTNVANGISKVVKEVLEEKDQEIVEEALEQKKSEIWPLNGSASSKGHPINRRKFLNNAAFTAIGAIGGILVSYLRWGIIGKNLEAEIGKMQLSRLRIGSIPQSNRISPSTQGYLDYYLSKKLDGIKVTTDFQPNTYQDAADALGSKDIEAALLGPYIYLYAAKKYRAKPIVLTLGTLNKDAYYYSYIITTPKSHIRSLKDLKGSNQEFAFGDKWSTSGYLYPLYFLKNAGIMLDSDITPVHHTDHVSTLQAVLQGIQPFGAVNSDVYNNEHLHKGDLIILNEEDSKNYPIPQGPCVLRADVQAYDTLRIKEAFLSIEADDPSALEDLATAQIGGFLAAGDQIYEKVRKIANEMGGYENEPL